MMGLHHISGKRRWPAINRARAMERLLPHFRERCAGRLRGPRRHQARVQPVGENAGTGKDAYERKRLRRPVAARSVQSVSGGSEERGFAGLDRLGPRHSRGFQPVEPQPALLVDVEREGEFGEGGEDDQDGRRRSTRGLDVRSGDCDRRRRFASWPRSSRIPRAVKRLDETRSLQEATLVQRPPRPRAKIDGAFKSCDRGIERLTSTLGRSGIARARSEFEQLMSSKLMGIIAGPQAATAGCRPPAAVAAFQRDPTKSQFSGIRTSRAIAAISGLTLDAPGRVNLIVGGQQRRQDVSAGGDLPVGAPERRKRALLGRHSLAWPDGGRSSAVLARRAASEPRPYLWALRRNAGQQDECRVRGGDRAGDGRRRPDFFSQETRHRIQLRRACTAHGCRVLRGPPAADPFRGAELALPVGVHEPVLGQPS